MSDMPAPSSTPDNISQPSFDARSSITWSQSPTPPPCDRSDACSQSLLWVSLLHIVQGPHALSQDLISSIADENNPCPLRTLMWDGTEYWVKLTGDVLHLDILALQKARAQFELVALDEHDDSFPEGAIKSSSGTLQLLFALFNEVESVQQKQDAAQNRQPSVIPFWHTYEPASGDHYAFIVSTDPLFHCLPNASRMSAPKMTHADIGTDVIFAESSTPLSPSKARAMPQHNKAQASKVGQKTPGAQIWEFSKLPDPDGHYAGLLNAHPDLAKAQVVSPDVRDQQGVLIAADHVQLEYSAKHKGQESEWLSHISIDSKEHEALTSSPTKKSLVLESERDMDFEVV
ncbi:hypothetical protein EDC04DRAFT_2603036 [Pisolithus marmoratus]|nr:hypothetical protein EDC04DRAFT_2603036 [Pisolithus marmoratus]